MFLVTATLKLNYLGKSQLLTGWDISGTFENLGWTVCLHK